MSPEYETIKEGVCHDDTDTFEEILKNMMNPQDDTVLLICQFKPEDSNDDCNDSIVVLSDLYLDGAKKRIKNRKNDIVRWAILDEFSHVLIDSGTTKGYRPFTLDGLSH